ncbi:MAG: Hsp20/alpha crystallin family protein [Chloroflexi bacterium]|nr:Hsp20/alpha crystallin family protein [Chloroflexota bacterium]
MLVRSSQLFRLFRAHSPTWRPPTDVYETEHEMIVQIEIAGMRDGHFHLSIQDRLMVVYGSRDDNTHERRAYHQLEIHSGDFRAEVELSSPVDTASVIADYDDGFLRIILPKLG